MSRYALFKDERGFYHCEEVDLDCVIYTKVIPSRKARRTWWGKTISPARKGKVLHLTVNARIDGKNFKPDSSYKLNHQLVYVYGRSQPVKVIRFIKCHLMAEYLRNMLENMTPEVSKSFAHKRGDSKPYYGYNRIAEGIIAIAT